MLVIMFMAGFLGGLCSSAPLGPINLFVIKMALARAERQVIWFISGVVIVDIGFASLAVFGSYGLLQQLSSSPLWQRTGAFLLTGIGCYSLWQLSRSQPINLKSKQDIRSFSLLGPFGVGAVLCGSNPGFLLFWLLMVSQARTWGALESSIAGATLFLAGVFMGDLLWFRFLIRLARLGTLMGKPRLLLSIQRAIAFSLVIVGAIILIRSLLEFQ